MVLKGLYMEKERKVICWCAYHDTLICSVGIDKRRIEISRHKPSYEMKARFLSLCEVSDVKALPQEICAALDTASLLLPLVEKYRKVLVKQMRKEIPGTYWNGRDLSYNRVSLFFTRLWYRIVDSTSWL